MARTIRVELDARSERDLRVLGNEGHSDSEAIRLALHEATERRGRRSAVRAEAAAAAGDVDDLGEALAVLHGGTKAADAYLIAAAQDTEGPP